MSHCIGHRSQVFTEGLWGVKQPKFGWRHLEMISYQIFLERLELILKTFISLCQCQTISHRILDVILKQNLIQLQPKKIIHRILDVILKHKLNTVTTQKQNIRNPDYSRIQIMDTIVGNGVLSRWQQKFWSVQKIFWKMFYGGLLL